MNCVIGRKPCSIQRDCSKKVILTLMLYVTLGTSISVAREIGIPDYGILYWYWFLSTVLISSPIKVLRQRTGLELMPSPKDLENSTSEEEVEESEQEEEVDANGMDEIEVLGLTEMMAEYLED